MIKIRAKSLWRGQVGIRDKYIFQSLREKRDIVIYHFYAQMTIPFNKINELVVGKSEKPFPDRFSDEWHRLWYFKWEPTTAQIQLL